MVKDISIHRAASTEICPKLLQSAKTVKQALERYKRGLPPDTIKLEDIPF